MAALWEPEELVGRLWHRWASAAPSYAAYPEAAAQLKDLEGTLAVLFRALGGAGAVRIATAGAEASRHRLSLRQRLGLGAGEALERASLDWETLRLPQRLDCFPEHRLNTALYLWLAAWFAHAEPPRAMPPDPLQADLLTLRRARATSLRVLAQWPGLRQRYAELCAALRVARPARKLTGQEAALESVVCWMLGGDAVGVEARCLQAAVVDDSADVTAFHACRGYCPFLPVPLWGDVHARPAADRHRETADGEPRPGESQEVDSRRRHARRRRLDETAREDSLILSRFEYLLSLLEMVNLNRSVEDEDPESARQAADSMDEITLGNHDRQARTRLKLDLALAPQAANPQPLPAEFSYPEWDYSRRCYHPQHCRVIAETASEEGHDWTPDAAARRRIRAVRRQFEALRPHRHVVPMQRDGDELDVSALIRSVADQRAGGSGSDRVYLETRHTARDLAVALLVDVSLSTDSWVSNHRVLDVEKEAVLALSHGLAGCGDDHAVFTFTSRCRERVHVQTVKDFDEPLNARVERRLQALRPGYYTRIGAALRHVAGRIEQRPNRHRLLLLLTDGKPNDMDHYEGRYGVEDTRRAVREARRRGLSVFGITVDRKARDYFPYLFGRGAYAIIGRIERLPAVLPAIYRQMTLQGRR